MPEICEKTPSLKLVANSQPTLVNLLNPDL